MTTQKCYRMTDVTLDQLEWIRETLADEQNIHVNSTEAIAYSIQKTFWEMHKYYVNPKENP